MSTYESAGDIIQPPTVEYITYFAETEVICQEVFQFSFLFLRTFLHAQFLFFFFFLVLLDQFHI